jgi:hypothetical protein
MADSYARGQAMASIGPVIAGYFRAYIMIITRFLRRRARDYSSGTPGKCLAVRIVSEVLTLATLGAGVNLLVRNS